MMSVRFVDRCFRWASLPTAVGCTDCSRHGCCGGTQQGPLPARNPFLPSLRRRDSKAVCNHDALLGACAAHHVSLGAHQAATARRCLSLACGVRRALTHAMRVLLNSAPQSVALAYCASPSCMSACCRFREALEAAVVVSVLLQLVEKMNMRQLKKHGERGGKCSANTVR